MLAWVLNRGVVGAYRGTKVCQAVGDPALDTLAENSAPLAAIDPPPED